MNRIIVSFAIGLIVGLIVCIIIYEKSNEVMATNMKATLRFSNGNSIELPVKRKDAGNLQDYPTFGIYITNIEIRIKSPK